MQVVTRSAGTPYAESVQGNECWDFTQTNEATRVRHSFKVHFHSRPAFVVGKIEKGMSDSQTEGFRSWAAWAGKVAREIKPAGDVNVMQQI